MSLIGTRMLEQFCSFVNLAAETDFFPDLLRFRRKLKQILRMFYTRQLVHYFVFTLHSRTGGKITESKN
jgi:hypothetical protein